MNEMEIKRHSFDQAKARLKEFSERSGTELQIDKVKTDGGIFGFADHKVTGYELNGRLETIQNYFIDVYTTNNKIVKEFREVYNALNVLDRDYIASIIANVKAIEKTSNDVRIHQNVLDQHHEELKNQHNKLKAHQAEIDNSLETTEAIIKVLKKFKQELESYKHLTDVDNIWNDCKRIQNEVRVVSDSITKLSKKVSEDVAQVDNRNKLLLEQVNAVKENFNTIENSLQNIEKEIRNMQEHAEEIDSFVAALKAYEHLQDIDDMWTDLMKHSESIAVLSKDFTDAEEYAAESRKLISELQDFQAGVSAIEHLNDVDCMWKDVAEHTSRLAKSERSVGELTATIQKHQEEITATVEKNREETEAVIQKNQEEITEIVEKNREEVNERLPKQRRNPMRRLHL